MGRYDHNRPAPLAIHYSAWKTGLVVLFVAGLCAAWTWRSVQLLRLAPDPALIKFLMPVLGLILTLVMLGGAVHVYRRPSRVLLVGDEGLVVPDLYEETVPWQAITGATIVRGRGVVLQVDGGDRFVRKMTRNVRSSIRGGVPDMACIRVGLLDHDAAAILARIEAFRAAGHAADS